MALILLIDDAAFMRNLLRKMLVEEGHEVIEASNGKEGLELAASQKPDCLLVDLMMPVMDGLGVLNVLRLRGNTAPIIVLTADIQNPVKNRCLELGATRFLNKPPQPEKLRQAIKAVLKSTQNMSQ